MGYGPVNAPSSGGSSEELEAVRKLAQGAADTANTAKNTADTAKDTADAALEAANAARDVANTAKSTADSALALAGTAKSTADTAKSTADQALETANTAKSTADAAASAAEKAQQTADEAAQSIKDITNTISSTPSQNGSLVYNASVQSPTWNSYNPEQLTLGGVTEGTNAGEYEATFTPKGEYVWSDGTQDARTVTWTIKRKTVQLPAQSGSLTYTGSAQSPTWDNYSAVELDMGGTTSGTNAGSYQATFTPTSNFQWSDGTYGAKSAAWSIGKAAGSLSINPTTMTLDVSTLQKTIAVTRAGNGAISVSVDNTAVAEASLSGTTITVTGKAKGTAKITVSVAAGTNHTAPASAVCTATVSLPSKTLADNDPATIQAVGAAGTGASYWAVGDKIGIAVNLRRPHAEPDSLRLHPGLQPQPERGGQRYRLPVRKDGGRQRHRLCPELRQHRNRLLHEHHEHQLRRVEKQPHDEDHLPRLPQRPPGGVAERHQKLHQVQRQLRRRKRQRQLRHRHHPEDLPAGGVRGTRHPLLRQQRGAELSEAVRLLQKRQQQGQIPA